MTTSSHDRSSQTSAFSSKLPAFVYPQDDQSQRNLACHSGFSQNATHAFGDHRPLIKQPASCTVISDQLGPSLSCGCNATSICFVQPATTSDTHVHTHTASSIVTAVPYLHLAIPQPGLLNAHLHYTSHHNSGHITGLSQQYFRHHPKSRLLQRSYMAPRTQHFLYGPYSSQTDAVHHMQLCFRLWTGRTANPSSQVSFSYLARASSFVYTCRKCVSRMVMGSRATMFAFVGRFRICC